MHDKTVTRNIVSVRWNAKSSIQNPMLRPLVSIANAHTVTPQWWLVIATDEVVEFTRRHWTKHCDWMKLLSGGRSILPCIQQNRIELFLIKLLPILNVLITLARNILSVIVDYEICRFLINLPLMTHFQIILIPFNCFSITVTFI